MNETQSIENDLDNLHHNVDFDSAWDEFMKEQLQSKPDELETEAQSHEQLLNNEESSAFARFLDHLMLEETSPKQVVMELDKELHRLGTVDFDGDADNDTELNTLDEVAAPPPQLQQTYYPNMYDQQLIQPPNSNYQAYNQQYTPSNSTMYSYSSDTTRQTTPIETPLPNDIYKFRDHSPLILPKLQDPSQISTPSVHTPESEPPKRRRKRQRAPEEVENSRLHHVKNEQKRRHNIRDLYGQICNLVPEVRDANVKMPKRVVLELTYERVMHLVNENNRIRALIESKGIST